jgi:hypothetical protein
MISNFIPQVAVQVIARALLIERNTSDSMACFLALKERLRHMRLRSNERGRERVVFTVSHRKRSIRVVLSCAPMQEADVACDDTLYLNFGGPRLEWAYVAAYKEMQDRNERL